LTRFNKNIKRLKQLYRSNRKKFVTNNIRKNKFATNNASNCKTIYEYVTRRCYIDALKTRLHNI